MRLLEIRKREGICAFFALLMAGAGVAQADFQGSTHLMPFDEETINYSKQEPTSAIAKLQERINKGEVSLNYEPGFGYIRSLLEELKVPKSSQMLVFSKTSLQRERISPRNPRAIFFNDDVYIGFIPGAPLVEISAADPKLGAVFYTLEQVKKDKPRLVRTDQCLECHASAKSMGVPGHLVRSFATDETGVVDVNSGTSLVDHRTPLAERWGGWYVTGKHGKQAHRGNLVGKEAFERQEKEPNYLGNLESLDKFIHTEDYVGPHSDIVALMVLEHQTHMHNFITRLNYEATIRIAEYGAVKYLNSPTEAFLRYLLFVEETPLTEPIAGTSNFAKEFAANGPKDKKGRSLRDLQLQTRMFKYPCSYLIYSEAFEALPVQLKENIYQRGWNILNGKDSNPDFQKIPAETRRAILEILVDTKKNLPAYWKLEEQASAGK
jgi:hypothetical protein